METPPSYYEWERPEMLDFVPPGAKRILDVGCGAGAFSAGLKRARGAEVWGVEANPEAARMASARVDRVICDEFTSKTDFDSVKFDCIVFNDVLEHMVSPESALATAKSLLSPQGVVVASIPNVRHLSVVWELAVRGDWHYRGAGILDVTHLRFFTRRSILRMFRSQGYDVQRCQGINEAVGRKFRCLNLLFLNRLGDMRHMQYAVVAAPASQGACPCA